MKKKLLSLTLIALLALSTLIPTPQTSAATMLWGFAPSTAQSLTLYNGTTVQTVTPGQEYSWTSSGTETSYAAYSNAGNSLDDAPCPGGNPNYVTKIEVVASTESESPQANDENFAIAGYSPGEGSSLASLNFLPIELPINNQHISSFGDLQNPIEVQEFNNLMSGEFRIYIVHQRDGETSHTITTSAPSLQITTECGVQQGILDPTPTPQTATPQTKSPKTGASEVLIALFLVVLASSSFLIYKALHKHRNTNKLSEK